jgi:hypothetical protein
VQAVSGRGDGVLSTATTTVHVVVSVPADDAADVLGAIGGRGLVVVVRDLSDSGDDTADDAGDDSADARGRGAATSAPAGPTD